MLVEVVLHTSGGVYRPLQALDGDVFLAERRVYHSLNESFTTNECGESLVAPEVPPHAKREAYELDILLEALGAVVGGDITVHRCEIESQITIEITHNALGES